MAHDQRQIWNQVVGDAWVRHVDQFDATLAPFGQAVIDKLDPQEGERVLDVGCGVGTTTFELASRVGAGHVVGVDISAPMIDAARAQSASRGVTNTQFIEADAQTADLGPEAFDIVFSRFGVMFFPDPTAAFSNLAGALAPGGRLGFVCFAAPTANPFIMVPVMAAAAQLHLAPPAPGEPGPFALADPERLRGLLQQAGLNDISIEPGPTEGTLYGADDLPALAERLLEQNPATGAALQGADSATRSAAIGAVTGALTGLRQGDQIRLGAATWIVSARR